MSDVLEELSTVGQLADKAVALLIHYAYGLNFMEDGQITERTKLFDLLASEHEIDINDSSPVVLEIFDEPTIDKTLTHLFVDNSGIYTEKVKRLVNFLPRHGSSASLLGQHGHNLDSVPGTTYVNDVQKLIKSQNEVQEKLIRHLDEQRKNNTTTQDTSAVNNPKEMELIKLGSCEDSSEFDRWSNDIVLQVDSRIPGFGENILQKLLSGRSVILSPKDNQLLTILHRAIKTSLSDDLLKRLNASVNAREILDTPIDFLKELRRLVQYFRQTQVEREFTKLENANWKKTGGNLLAFLAYIKDAARKCGDELAAGKTRDRRVRQILIQNIDTKNPKIAHIVNDFSRHSASEKAYSADKLAEEVSRAMYEVDGDGEKQAEVFAAVIAPSSTSSTSTASVFKADSSESVVKLTRENQSLKDKLKNAEAQKNAEAFWGDGGGKGGHHQRHRHGPYHRPKGQKGKDSKTSKGSGNKGGGKGHSSGKGKDSHTRQSSTSSSYSHEKLCRCCGDYYNYSLEKSNAWKSHNTKDCKWKTNNGSQSKGDSKKGGRR